MKWSTLKFHTTMYSVLDTFIKDKTQWHSYFCWVPRRNVLGLAEYEWVWLEVIERRLDTDTYDFYHYRLKGYV